MLFSNIINDGFGLLSKQLKFYCWHYKRDLDSRQQQELIDLLNEHYFEKLACKIRSLMQSNIDDCKQQIGKLLFEQCLTRHRRNQLIQLVQSDLVDINVRLDNYGRTLLHRTAYNLDVELVKLLIDHGVNIKSRDYAGNTALHIAIQSYRNGAHIYNNEPEVVQNLTTLIELLLEADKRLQFNHSVQKRIKLDSVKQTKENLCERIAASNKISERATNDNQECKLNMNYSVQSTPTHQISDGQQFNLVAKKHSPQRDDTICRIMGSQFNCKFHTNTHQQTKFTSQANKVGDIRTRESHLQESSSTTKATSINQTNAQSDFQSCPFFLDEDSSISLVDTKNAFGRTALHYCVLVLGEHHLDHFVKLLISYGADTDVIDTRLKTPLYCLVKRPGISAVRQKCQAITHLIESGCDDLGLAIDQPRSYFTEDYISKLEANIATFLQKGTDEQTELIFTHSSFKRLPSLKHLARLTLIKHNDDKNGRSRRQTGFWLPSEAPHSLNHFINRKILTQIELF